MQSSRILLSVMCVALVANAAFAADEAATKPSVTATTAAVAMPKLEPVLQYIPADALGFAVVNNVAAMASDVDKYLEQIGLTPLLAGKMPNGPLEMIKTKAKLGAGFNPNGGFAFVMLDPNKFNIDIAAMICKKQEAASEPAPAPTEPKLPWAIFVPGSSVKDVFGNYTQAPAGKYTEVSLRMGKVLAAQMGGYVVFSPIAEVIDTIAAAGKKVELTKTQAEMVANSDVAIHLNMEIAAPTIDSLLKTAKAKLAEEQAANQAMPAEALNAYIDFYNDLFSQISGLTVSARFAQTGLVFESMVDFKANSKFGSLLAAWKPVGSSLLNKAPEASYILAVGTQGNVLEKKEYLSEMMDKLFVAFPKLDDQAKATLKELSVELNDQVTGAQFVVGAAPEGSGILGAAYILDCKDASKIKALLGEKMPTTIEALIKATSNKQAETAPAEETPTAAPATSPMEEMPNWKLVYTPKAEKIGDLPVDTVEIVLKDMPADAKEGIVKLLGEDKLRVFIAAPDEKTVILTFGGGLAYLQEAIKTAKEGSGKILEAPGSVEAMKYLPKNLGEVFLFNVGNLFDIVNKGMRATSGEGAAIPFQITSKTPIALGVAAEDSSLRMALYVPNDLVKEIVGIVQGFMGGFMEGFGGPGSGQPGSAPAMSDPNSF